MVQRSNFGYSDNIALRQTFQQAAVEAMEK